MKTQAYRIDRKTAFLPSNGNIPAWSTHAIQESEWNKGIRPLNEDDLQPDLLVRKKRRGPNQKAAGAGRR
jgi:hypothetical protein